MWWNTLYTAFRKGRRTNNDFGLSTIHTGYMPILFDFTG
jgi:hypothetical protein